MIGLLAMSGWKKSYDQLLAIRGIKNFQIESVLTVSTVLAFRISICFVSTNLKSLQRSYCHEI